MMQMLNKFAALIAIGIIGYLTYSSLGSSAAKPAAEGKSLPVVTKKMLKPVFLEAQEHVSPVGRNPFEVAGFENELAYETAGNETGSVTADGSNNVRFPQSLMGVLTGDDGQKLALIGGDVYGVGSQISPDDSNMIWEISSIEDEEVILTCNGLQAVLNIAGLTTDNNDAEQTMPENDTDRELKQ